MGIYITAYAFNAPRMAELLELPLWRIFDRRSLLPPNDDPPFFSVHDSENRARYCLDARRDLIRLRPYQRVDRAEAASLCILQPTGRTFLTGPEASGTFGSLLHDLALDPPTTGVHKLTGGYRRWWIGSLLAAASQSRALSPAEFQTLHRFLARILHHFDCDFPATAPPDPNPPTLPFLPQDDTDYCMALFDHAETIQLLHLFDKTLNANPDFQRPPESTTSPGDETDWNAYVRLLTSHFSSWRTLSPSPTHLVTFIG